MYVNVGGKMGYTKSECPMERKGSKRKDCEEEDGDMHREENAMGEAWNDGSLLDKKYQKNTNLQVRRLPFRDWSGRLPRITRQIYDSRVVLSWYCVW